MARGRGAKRGGSVASVATQLDRSTGSKLKEEIVGILDRRPEITSAIADIANYLHDNPHQCSRLLQWMHVGLETVVEDKPMEFPRSYSQIRFLAKAQLIKDIMNFQPEVTSRCVDHIQKNNPAETLMRLFCFATKCGPKDKLFSKQVSEFMMKAKIRYQVYGNRLHTLPALLQANSGKIEWGQTMGYYKLLVSPDGAAEPSIEIAEGSQWTHVMHIGGAVATQIT